MTLRYISYPEHTEVYRYVPTRSVGCRHSCRALVYIYILLCLNQTAPVHLHITYKALRCAGGIPRPLRLLRKENSVKRRKVHD